MGKASISKKALRSLMADTLNKAISQLELPRANKKVKKLVGKSAKKIADEFSHLLKKKNKKAAKGGQSLTYIEDVLKGKKKKKKQDRKGKSVGIVLSPVIEPKNLS